MAKTTTAGADASESLRAVLSTALECAEHVLGKRGKEKRAKGKKKRMAQRPAILKEPSPLLTTGEAMAIGKCCRSTLAVWMAEGLFKSFRPIAAGSGRRLIDRASFLAFLERGAA